MDRLVRKTEIPLAKRAIEKAGLDEKNIMTKYVAGEKIST